MSSTDPLTKVRALAGRLGELNAPDDDGLRLVGFAIGAAYALERSLINGYANRPMGPNAAETLTLRLTAKAVATGNAPCDGEWVAGYHFNSCLMRLAALGDRIGKYETGAKWHYAPEVNKDVNRLKHDVGVELSLGRPGTPAHALRALETVIDRLQALFMNPPSNPPSQRTRLKHARR